MFSNYTCCFLHSLLWLNKIEKPIGRLCRWAILLSQFDYELIYRPGKNNIVPDALSRSLPENDILISILTLETQNIDNWYNNLLKDIKDSSENYPLFRVEDGVLYKHFECNSIINTNQKSWKIVVPNENRNKILNECHDSPFAHFGIKKTFSKTFNKIYEQFWWPAMRRDVKRFISKCKICHEQKVSSLGRMGLMGAPKNISIPFQLFSIDIQVPFPRSKSGNCYLLVIVDWFTHDAHVPSEPTVSGQ